MRVFLTGATGFIGTAITDELVAAGHTVLGMARSDATIALLAARGIEAHRGELSDVDSLAAGAAACDGVIHTAFNHDWSTPRDIAADTDRLAVEALAGAMVDSGKPLIVTSGTALLEPGRLGTERDAAVNTWPRAASEDVVQRTALRGVRACVLRLPPSVHGAGDRGFVPMLIDIARRTGVSAFVGNGSNRWPAVHRFDAARLYRLALEHGAAGARLHGVAEEGLAMRDIAAAIGAGLNLPVRGLTPDEAREHFEWFADFVAIDNPVSSAITREALDWKPQQVGLLADMAREPYFSK